MGSILSILARKDSSETTVELIRAAFRITNMHVHATNNGENTANCRTQSRAAHENLAGHALLSHKKARAYLIIPGNPSYSHVLLL
jgi:hypothetical protein